jgi:4-diphosphocytidyl-2-C-methyl-D-erythritol kinase
MQNKANFRKSQMNVSPVITREYKNNSNWTLGENKPNSKPIKANFQKGKMNVNKVLTRDYENNSNWALFENKPNINPIQTQSNPISEAKECSHSDFCFSSAANFLCSKKRQSAIMSTDITNTSWTTMVSKEQIATVGPGLLVRAPAKINLSLLIAGKRPDGFHEIETVMAKVNFYDEILIEPGEKAGIELVCKGPHWAPEGKENLVYQACELLLNSCGVWTDSKITLTKNIPAASGLGSASSDAAATLIGLNQYMEFGLPNRELAKLAKQLGSDVAFFLDGPLAFCRGKGEKIRKITKKFNFLALLILPDVSVSTKKVYANYRHNAAVYEQLSSLINRDIEKNRFDLVWKMCANMLEESCYSLYRELAELKARIESLGIGPLCLSGSCSALFSITDSMYQDKAS